MDTDSSYYELYEKQYGYRSRYRKMEEKNNETKNENKDFPCRNCDEYDDYEGNKMCNSGCEKIKEYNKGIDIFDNPKETIEFLNEVGVNPVLISPFGIKKDKIEYRLFVKYDMSSEFQTRGANKIRDLFNDYTKLTDSYGKKLSEIESTINTFGLEYKWRIYSIDGMFK